MNGTNNDTTTCDCAVDPFSSRACNRGTKGCTLRHWTTRCVEVAATLGEEQRDNILAGRTFVDAFGFVREPSALGHEVMDYVIATSPEQYR